MKHNDIKAIFSKHKVACDGVIMCDVADWNSTANYINELHAELETLKRNICIYFNEEVSEIFDEDREDGDQQVYDFLQKHYENWNK